MRSIFSSSGRHGALWLSSLVLGGSLQAGLITIANDSFEQPIVTGYGFGITSWNTDSGDAGTWSSANAGAVGLSPLPDGGQTGWLTTTFAGVSAISQDLGVSLAPNSAYTLSIYVGGRTDGYNPGTSYGVELWAGSSLLTAVTPVTPPTAAWTQLSASYASDAAPLAGNLRIAIWNNSPSGATQLVFDKVELAMVPEPQQAALVALGLVAVASYRRRRG